MALSRYYSIPVLRPTVDELNDLSRFLEKHMPEFREVRAASPRGCLISTRRLA